MDNGTYAHFTGKTRDTRKWNQDSWLSRELNSSSVLDAVLDGNHVGHASKIARKKLEEQPIGSVEEVIKQLCSAHDEILQKYRGFSGTTATIAFKINNDLYVINIGDSPAYLIRDGKHIELTVGHRKADDPAQLTGALGHDKSFLYVIENYSLEQLMKNKRYIQVTHSVLQSQDRLVLLTDGVSDNINPEEIAEIVSSQQTPRKAVS